MQDDGAGVSAQKIEHVAVMRIVADVIKRQISRRLDLDPPLMARRFRKTYRAVVGPGAPLSSLPMMKIS